MATSGRLWIVISDVSNSSRDKKNKINRKLSEESLTILLDTGASSSIVSKEVVKNSDIKCAKTAQKTVWNTPSGKMCTGRVALVQFVLDEFSTRKTITWKFHVAASEQKLGYDMIIGRDLLRDLAMIIDFSKGRLVWDDVQVEMSHELGIGEINIIIPSTESRKTVAIHRRAERILDATQDPMDLSTKVEESTNLSTEERQKLYSLLNKYKKLFDGTLGHFKGSPAILKLKKGTEPVRAAPFPVAVSRRDQFKKELQRLVDLGVLAKEHESPWASPSFLIPKTDGSVRFLTDFRKLNKNLIRRPFPLPKILDLIQTQQGFKYASTLDLSMGYYTIELSLDSQKICTITTPYGRHKYLILPMGVS